MKLTIVVIFLSLFMVACNGRSQNGCGGEGILASKTIDIRCDKIWNEAIKKGEENNVCYSGPLTRGGLGKQPQHPDPVACKALYAEAQKKCADLPPAGPDDIDTLSGGAIYAGKKPIMIDGKPVMIDGKSVCP